MRDSSFRTVRRAKDLMSTEQTETLIVKVRHREINKVYSKQWTVSKKDNLHFPSFSSCGHYVCFGLIIIPTVIAGNELRCCPSLQLHGTVMWTESTLCSSFNLQVIRRKDTSALFPVSPPQPPLPPSLPPLL